MSYLMLAVTLIGFAISLPVAAALGLAGIAGLWLSGANMLILPKEIFSAIDKFPLAAIPFFILAGNIMERGGISSRLVALAKAMVGGLPGGLAATCVLTCMMFAAVSGSSIATTFAIGAILIPALVKHGYPRGYAGALQATSAELGIILPPSIPLILYGVAAEVSIGQLFIAAIGPGLFVGTVMLIFTLLYCRYKGYGQNDHVDRLPVAHAFLAALPALSLPIIILGGIYTGITTPTEASIIAVFAALIVGMGIYREVKIRDIPVILHKSVISVAMIMIIIACAGLFSYMITRAGVPDQLGRFLTEHFESKLIFLIVLNIGLLLIGMILETNSAVLVLTPIIAPVAIQIGVDPVHLGLIMIVALAIGMVTPPMAVNVFAACTVGKIPFDHVVPRLIPMIGMMILCLIVITYVPEISLFMRDFIYK
ncbi:TRAP transporter large permease [Paracoccus onubensis]|uniref:TRAP transporter large permease n=1 Tax=Paracoccus onubensis TaxID=1675788 RepID=UPI00272F6ECB|nr:TRAP transporter large permease [Paracoccus onubensis]MDP0929856.1 TRAP transporter large permease [Paracoccus onubensis]